MKITRKMFAGIAMAAVSALCIGASTAKAATFHVVASACGTWNDANQHTTNEYFTGFSTERPHATVSYFVFSLNSFKGRTVTNCTTTIPGTTDYAFTASWGNHPAGQTAHQFKIGMAPMNPARMNVRQVETGVGANQIWRYARGEQDLGYNWLLNGLHRGTTFDTFHYNTARFQAAVNAGGDFVIFGCDRFDSGNTGEQYVWGQSHISNGIILNVTTR